MTETKTEKKTLAHWRKSAGLTQLELAERACVNDSFLGELERGLRELSGRQAQRVVRALGITVSQVIKENALEHLDTANWHEIGYAESAPRKNLRWWRETRGITHLELMALSGVAKSQITYIENDEISTCRPATKRALARALQVPPDKLILPGDDRKETAERPLEDVLRSELRGSRQALKKAYDFIREDPNVALKALDKRDAILPQIERELRGL